MSNMSEKYFDLYESIEKETIKPSNADQSDLDCGLGYYGIEEDDIEDQLGLNLSKKTSNRSESVIETNTSTTEINSNDSPELKMTEADEQAIEHAVDTLGISYYEAELRHRGIKGKLGSIAIGGK